MGYIDRKRLFNLINELPTVFDVVTGKKPVKEKPRVNNNSNSGGNKTKPAAKVVSDSSVNMFLESSLYVGTE